MQGKSYTLVILRGSFAWMSRVLNSRSIAPHGILVRDVAPAATFYYRRRTLSFPKLMTIWEGREDEGSKRMSNGLIHLPLSRSASGTCCCLLNVVV